jgi:hypothetical protein
MEQGRRGDKGERLSFVCCWGRAMRVGHVLSFLGNGAAELHLVALVGLAQHHVALVPAKRQGCHTHVIRVRPSKRKAVGEERKDGETA